MYNTRNPFHLWRYTQSFSFMKIHTITDESPQHISLKKKAMQPPCEVRISVSCTTSASLHITAPSSSSRESIKIISPISAAPSNLSVWQHPVDKPTPRIATSEVSITIGRRSSTTYQNCIIDPTSPIRTTVCESRRWRKPPAPNRRGDRTETETGTEEGEGEGEG